MGLWLRAAPKECSWLGTSFWSCVVRVGSKGPTKTSRTEMQDLTVELGSVACAEEARVSLTATAKVY